MHFTKDREYASRTQVKILLTRLSGRPGVERRAYGSGLPDAAMLVSWTPADWRRFSDARGYVLDLYDPLRARVTDGAGVEWLVRCVPALSGPALDAWVGGISGWAAELYAA